jgi:hypothetical protein
LSTSPTSPAPEFGQTEAPVKRILWKWSIAVAAVVLVFLMWQCGSALVHGQKLATASVRHFHQQLNAEEYEEIYREADEGFRAGQSHDELIKFLQVVHGKLGNADHENQVNIRVDTNTRGTFTTTWYNTTFVNGTASERFTWVTGGDVLKLYAYHVESNALLAD